jgi:NAD(P)H-flavin reductase
MNAPLASMVDPFVPHPYRVERAKRETSDMVTLEIVPVAGTAVPASAPGQFNMLYAFGVGEVAISMSGDPADTSKFVHTVRSVGAVSGAISAMKAGAVLGVRGPYGTAWPVEVAEGSDVVIVAGGLGMAPLRPAVYRILANRERYGRVVLLYGARNPKDILYPQEIGQWRRSLDLAIEVTVDHADTKWRGNVGVVPALLRRVSFDPMHTVAMVCGPEVMMRFTAAALRDAGVTPDRIYLSMERNMKCAVGLCGHCQFGPTFICKDGAVMTFERIAPLLAVREI